MLRLPGVHIEIDAGTGQQLIGFAGSDATRRNERFAITYRGEPVGCLIAYLRAGEQKFGTADVAVLGDLARLAARRVMR